MKSQWQRNDSLVTRFGKPLVSLFPANPSLSDPSWDYEHVSTSLVQTRIGIRWEDIPSLHVRWSLLNIPKWYISFPLDHSGVWVSWWIFDVGEWRRGCSRLFIHHKSPIFSFFKELHMLFWYSIIVNKKYSSFIFR